MVERIEIRNVPQSDLRRLMVDLRKSGAKNIKSQRQPDGTHVVSYLPGDPDFPTDLPEEEEDLPGDPDFDTD
jgi:hypothetical protein